MMLRIDSVPPIVLSAPVVLSVGIERSAVNGEVPNVPVTLDNARGQLTSLFANPPLRARATVTDGDKMLVSGIVRAITMSSVITLEIES